MTNAPTMDWHVPCSPEDLNIARVPPVAVKVPVGKLQDLTKEVEERVKCEIEEADPDEVIGNLK